MTAMQDYLEAEKVFSDAQRAWNALSPEERRSTASAANNHPVMAAAEAFAADAAGRHHIEERAAVYLKLGTNGWEIDSPTDDGYGLEGYEDGPISEGCNAEGSDAHDDDECRALKKAATWIETPTAPALARLLTDYCAVSA